MTYRSIAFPKHQQTTHRGLVTICVLTCLLVATSLAMLVMQAAIRERREISLRHQMLQTEFLLDAGVQLARSRIMASTDYQGETWIPNAASTGFPNATVVIQLNDDHQTFEVIASLGVAPDNDAHIAAHQTRRSYKLSIVPTTNVSE
jgi:type II secretory pathway component PulK